MSFDRLIEASASKKSFVCAGLDPTLGYIPDEIKKAAFKEAGEGLAGAAEAVLRFNKALVDSFYDIIPAIKPQCAYYEALGFNGMKALKDTVDYARKKGLFVIIDGKRGDIGSTAAAYASAYLGASSDPDAFYGDALTVNGYLGSDGLTPFCDMCEKNDRGIFVLVKTSNPSSGQLQDKMCGEKTVFEQMGEICEKQGENNRGKYGYSAVGAVVGATWPKQLSELRKKLPHTFFLVPGYGAQGGAAADVAGAFDENHRGAVINSSRGIMCAWQKRGLDGAAFADAAREECIKMNNSLNEVIF